MPWPMRSDAERCPSFSFCHRPTGKSRRPLSRFPACSRAGRIRAAGRRKTYARLWRVSAFESRLFRQVAGSLKPLRALAEDLEGLDRGGQVSDALRRIAATTACHAAVKANYPLTHAKMLHILEELRRTAYSTVCPHGRPVLLRLTRREIEKNFQRI